MKALHHAIEGAVVVARPVDQDMSRHHDRPGVVARVT
jgi:hypothetical protein